MTLFTGKRAAKPFWLRIALLFISAFSLAAQAKKAATPAAAAAPAAPASSGSNGPLESQMLAFGGLDYIAANIAQQVCKADGIADTPNILIFDQASMANIQAYTAFVSNAKLLVAAYNNVFIPPPPVSNPPAKTTTKDMLHQLEKMDHLDSTTVLPQSTDIKPGGFVNKDLLTQHGDYLLRRLEELSITITGDPLSDVSGLVQAIASSSNTETASSSTIPDSALAVLITQKIAARKDDGCKGKAVIYPPLYGYSSVSDYAAVDIETYLSWVNAARKAAYTNLNLLLTDAETQDKITTKHAAVVAQLTDINGLYDSFMNSLLQVNSSTGVIGSAAIVQGRKLAILMSGHKKGEDISGDDAHKVTTDPLGDVAPAYVLLATIVTSGGTQRDHKTFWTSLGSGDQITYSGGAIVNVALWKANSPTPVYSAELRYRTPFLSLKDPSQSTGVDAGDDLSNSSPAPNGKPRKTQ
jgi:hypothetical protein